MYEEQHIAQLDRIATALEAIANVLLDQKDFASLTRLGGNRNPLPPVEGLDDLVSRTEGTSGNGLIARAESSGSDEVDAASLAREAEELLNAAATPEVKKEVDVGEGSKPEKSQVKINLFKQDRDHDIFDLAQACPQDDVVEVWRKKVALRVKPGTDVTWHSLTPEEQVLAAAIELVYTHLPHDMWGGEEAAKAVKQFVDQHSEEA